MISYLIGKPTLITRESPVMITQAPKRVYVRKRALFPAFANASGNSDVNGKSVA